MESVTDWQMSRGDPDEDAPGHVVVCIYCGKIVDDVDDCYARKIIASEAPEEYEWEYACVPCVEEEERTD